MMESAQLDLLEYSPPAPAARRDAAMTSVTAHAEKNHPGWTVAALAWIAKYAETHAFFIAEECTQAAVAAGITPHDLRGWGSLYPKSARNGVIAKHGYGTSPRRNLSPTPMWRSLHPNFARPA